MSNGVPDINDRLVKWFAESGLYQSFLLNAGEIRTLAIFIKHYQGFRVDCYCPSCRDQSVFTVQLATAGLESAINREKIGARHEVVEWLENTLCELTLKCAREDRHELRLFLHIERTNEDALAGLMLTKIGQLPSHFDLMAGDLRKYSKVADDADLRELNSAAICHSHGYHVAAFVYLRRVFERRLEIAHQRAREDVAWDEEKYDPRAMRMEDRIAALAHHLPTFLVENRGIYGILSKAVHDLTEEECQDAYAAMELAVRLILDEEIEQKERAKRVTGAKLSIQKLTKRLGKK